MAKLFASTFRNAVFIAIQQNHSTVRTDLPISWAAIVLFFFISQVSRFYGKAVDTVALPCQISVFTTIPQDRHWCKADLPASRVAIVHRHISPIIRPIYNSAAEPLPVLCRYTAFTAVRQNHLPRCPYLSHFNLYSRTVCRAVHIC